MQIIYSHCCGLDVHKQTVVACFITPNGKEIRSFGTMTGSLLEMADWLVANNCQAVAMESTGVYWKPIYNILEATGIKILVVNAHHIKNVPGRKTDVKDSEWIADLLQHGLLHGSYIPDRDQRELRELVRYRTKLTQERSREVNRIQKVLEAANIKLGDVTSDVMGKSGQDILRAIISGNSNPQSMAQMARGRLKSKTELLEKALTGLIGPHQKMLLETQLRHIDFLNEEIQKLSQEIESRMRPFEKAIEALDGIPGISRTNAEQILCETGLDMSRFPTDKHFASWAALCPGNNDSAGKRKSGKTRKGNMALKAALTQAAISASRTKGAYFNAMYRRLAARRGKNKAIIAVAHAILVTIYHMLKDGSSYRDLGVNHYDQINKEAVIKRSIKRIEILGYKVTLEPVAA
ncbi:MAG: IS110 family transposase [Bacillota bacterium]